MYRKDFKAPGSIARVDKNIVLFPEKEGLDGLEYEIFYTIEKQCCGTGTGTVGTVTF